MNQDLDALPLPEPDGYAGRDYYHRSSGMFTVPVTENARFTEQQIRADRIKVWELAMRKAQEGREQTTAQGKINAELDTDSNTSESQQRRHMAGSLEVGQLVGDRQDSRSGDIEPQGEKSLERWLCGIMKPIAEDIAKNCSTAPQLVIAPLIWGIEDLLKSGALFTSSSPKSDEASEALALLDSGEWELTRHPDTDSMLTDEWCAKNRWSVRRTTAPFCGRDGVRCWSAPTPLEAFAKARAALTAQQSKGEA